MKKILLTILMLFPLLSFGQLSFEQSIMLTEVPETEHKVDLKLTKGSLTKSGTGPIMLLAGSSLILAGVLTKSDRELKDGQWVDKPFLNQGPRAFAMLSGVGVFTGGIVFIINGN